MSDNKEKILSEKEQARLEAQFEKEKQPERITLESFSAKVADKAGVEQDKAKTYIHGMFDYIGDGLKNEDSISVFRFGTFKKKWKEERDGFNPQTQEPLKIPAHYKVTFSPSEPLANEVNRKYRQLRPNVIDELLTLTGVTKVSSAYLAMIEKNEEMHARHVRARKRAIIVLIILL
ncbi:MAG: HU family DNA-binding protein, partial [Spirochaetales bacterium]|nr:HU family DNA-binding protein [Spirochaetales bacterium]